MAIHGPFMAVFSLPWLLDQLWFPLTLPFHPNLALAKNIKFNLGFPQG